MSEKAEHTPERDPAFLAACESALYQLRIYLQQGKFNTEAEQREAVIDAVSHAAGILSISGFLERKASCLSGNSNSYPALLAERDRLREALKPFDWLVDYYKALPDNHQAFVNVGDLRRARAVLKDTNQ